jgi:hypothetical protein
MYKKNIAYFVVIILLILTTFYYFQIKKSSNSDQKLISNKVNELQSNTISEKVFTNTDHKLTINYPEKWLMLDLGGDKNVTDPLKVENIIMFFDNKEGQDPTQNLVSSASAKIIRFIIEKDSKILSSDDWLGYIQAKIEASKSTQIAQENEYNLISLEKHTDINGNWAVEENYTETSDLRGRDIYIYNNGEFYQIICKTKIALYEPYTRYFDLIINSFTIAK